MEKNQKLIPLEKTDRPIIFVDKRELASDIVCHLKTHDAIIRTEQLEVADYICSDRVGCERKSITDFLQSITNQRVFKQLDNLANSFARPVLIIEGNPKLLFLERNMHENAIRGAISSIAIDYNIPIIWTLNPKETACMIFWIAHREQILQKRNIQIRSNKKATTLKQQQEFLVAGLTNVSTKLSKRLLKYFKTAREIFNASREELMLIDGIGKEKAKKIYNLINSKYNDG